MRGCECLPFRHPNPRDIYAERLLAEGIIGADHVRGLEAEYKKALEEDLLDSRKVEKTRITPFMHDEWEGYAQVTEAGMLATVDTSFALDDLNAIAERITSLPEGKKFLRKLERLVESRRAMYFDDNKLDWAMGELLAYCGKHGEAEAWVRKSMRLNPFHPQRYWTHLARPLFHLGRYQEALTALEHITRLRRDDHVYRVAASAGLGDAAIAKRSVVALREAFPDLDPVAFARAMPYEREADRQAILHALQKLD